MTKVLETSCNFWSVSTEEYILTDQNGVMLPVDLTVGRLFNDSNGIQMHDLVLINKYVLGFEITERHKESIEIMKNTGNTQGGGAGGDQDLKKEIKVTKEASRKMDSAPQEFFKK